LSFDVTGTVSGNSVSYTFKAKDIGSSNAKLRIDMTATGQDITYIVNGATQTAWMYVMGAWTDMSSSFSTQWSTWNTAFSGYETGLAGWTSGDYTYTDSTTGATVTISNIQVNPSLDDSLFTHTA
jgi:ABC-type oligopeptide transport system substrate-binding subunit